MDADTFPQVPEPTYRPVVGDKVLFTVVGTVRRIYPSGAFDVDALTPDHMSIKRLPKPESDPEPEWHAGDVVVDADGEVWRRSYRPDGDRCWYLTGEEDAHPHKAPLRPLTLLVRDGKPVKES